MMYIARIVLVGVVSGCAIVTAPQPAHGQTAAAPRAAVPTAPSDPIAALTAELRALRTELADTARANLRLQLLVARLQMQEQRIVYLDRQRAEMATRLAEAQQQRAAMAGRARQGIPRDAPPELREEIQRHAEHLKGQLAVADANIQRLQSDESQAAGSVAAEQGRWNDFNARLDELERSLPQR